MNYLWGIIYGFSWNNFFKFNILCACNTLHKSYHLSMHTQSCLCLLLLFKCFLCCRHFQTIECCMSKRMSSAELLSMLREDLFYVLCLLKFLIEIWFFSLQKRFIASDILCECLVKIFIFRFFKEIFLQFLLAERERLGQTIDGYGSLVDLWKS